jgi:hypothetical protein
MFNYWLYSLYDNASGVAHQEYRVLIVAATRLHTLRKLRDVGHKTYLINGVDTIQDARLRAALERRSYYHPRPAGEFSNLYQYLMYKFYIVEIL